MTMKDQIVQELDRLPEAALQEVFDFIQFLEEKARKGKEWGMFALDSGAFDFWNAPEEVEYTVQDLKERQ